MVTVDEGGSLITAGGVLAVIGILALAAGYVVNVTPESISAECQVNACPSHGGERAILLYFPGTILLTIGIAMFLLAGAFRPIPPSRLMRAEEELFLEKVEGRVRKPD